MTRFLSSLPDPRAYLPSPSTLRFALQSAAVIGAAGAVLASLPAATIAGTVGVMCTSLQAGSLVGAIGVPLELSTYTLFSVIGAITFLPTLSSAGIIASTQFPSSIDLANLAPGVGVTLLGNSSGDYSGFSVEVANGAVVIGAPGVNNGTGAVYVCPGSATMREQRTISLGGANNGCTTFSGAANERAGFSVNGVGKIRGDGRHAFFIGTQAGENLGYVVFWPPILNNTQTVFELSQLNGTDGFRIHGNLGANHAAGSSSSEFGDVVGNGIDDLVVAIPDDLSSAGVTRIWSGSPTLGVLGTLELSSAEVTFIGRSAGSLSGYALQGGTDVDLDGKKDILVGAPHNDVGYVILGSSTIGSQVAYELSNLDSPYGFNVTATALPSQDLRMGVSAAAIRNLDNETNAFVFCASYNNTCAVIFSAPYFGSAVSFPISSLNGVNGVKTTVVGEEVRNGQTAAGFYNFKGDSRGGGVFVDGTYGDQGVAFARVLFGESFFGTAGTVSLSESALNGNNGFAIRYAPYALGELVFRGRYVAAGGLDANSLPVIMLGGYNASNGTGASYIVFGDAISHLLSNALTIHKGQRILLNSKHLNATLINATDNGKIRFTFSNIQHGYFSLATNPLTPITNVTQEWITNGSLFFTHDNSLYAPNFSTEIGYGYLARMLPQVANIVFRNVSSNSLSLSVMQSFSASVSRTTGRYTVDSDSRSISASQSDDVVSMSRSSRSRSVRRHTHSDWASISASQSDAMSVSISSGSRSQLSARFSSSTFSAFLSASTLLQRTSSFSHATGVTPLAPTLTTASVSLPNNVPLETIEPLIPTGVVQTVATVTTVFSVGGGVISPTRAVTAAAFLRIAGQCANAIQQDDLDPTRFILSDSVDHAIISTTGVMAAIFAGFLLTGYFQHKIRYCPTMHQGFSKLLGLMMFFFGLNVQEIATSSMARSAVGNASTAIVAMTFWDVVYAWIGYQVHQKKSQDALSTFDFTPFYEAAREFNDKTIRDFGLIEMAAGNTLAILSGMRSKPELCGVVTGLMLLVALADLVYVGRVKPYRARPEQGLATGAAALQVMLALLNVATLFENRAVAVLAMAEFVALWYANCQLIFLAIHDARKCYHAWRKVKLIKQQAGVLVAPALVELSEKHQSDQDMVTLPALPLSAAEDHLGGMTSSETNSTQENSREDSLESIGRNQVVITVLEKQDMFAETSRETPDAAVFVPMPIEDDLDGFPDLDMGSASSTPCLLPTSVAHSSVLLGDAADSGLQPNELMLAYRQHSMWGSSPHSQQSTHSSNTRFSTPTHFL